MRQHGTSSQCLLFTFGTYGRCESNGNHKNRAGLTYEIVFFSVTFTSGRALFRTLRSAFVLALIRE